MCGSEYEAAVSNRRQKLVLRVRRYRARGAKPVELDPMRRRHDRHRGLQRVGIELLPHLHQRVQRGVEDFQAVVGDRVVLVNRELPETGASRQALRELEFQILKTGAPDGTAKTHDGGFADANAMGQVGHGAVHHGRRIKQHMIGYLELRLTQEMAGLGDVLQQIQRTGLNRRMGRVVAFL